MAKGMFLFVFVCCLFLSGLWCLIKAFLSWSSARVGFLLLFLLSFFSIFLHTLNRLRAAVAQSVERATSGEEVPGSIPAVAARSLLVGSVSV